MNDRICPACGKPVLSAYPHQRFCNQDCYNAARPRKIKICAYCHQPFPPGAKGRLYCSAKCRQADGWRHANPAKRETRICEECGKEFETWAYRPTRFCSRLCGNRYLARLPKPKARRPENFVELACEICGKPFLVHKCLIEDPDRHPRFCSVECRANFTSENFRGEGNPHWRGGHVTAIDYGPNWSRQRRKAVRRDQHTCRLCGYKSGGDRILDVHHIKPLKEFEGDWHKANRISNLITLCRNCHFDVELGKTDCPSIKANSAIAPDS